VNDPRWARSRTPGEWERARLAYQALVRADDPAGSLLSADDVVDLRPRADLSGWCRPSGCRSVIVAGPDDLAELRQVVERSLGVGTWPRSRSGPELAATTRTATILLPSAGPALSLLMAMEGLIEDRSPWRRWRTAVETIASEVEALESLTAQATVLPSRVDLDR
jgi:hypothetical protein